jgi:two-component sensor histidine kinase
MYYIGYYIVGKNTNKKVVHMENIDKKRITVYLDIKLVELAHLNVDNLSELINNLLTTYLSVSTTEEIQNQIKDHQDKIKALVTRQQDLLKKGMAEDHSEGMKQKLDEELKQLYKIRRATIGDNQDLDFDWMNSPKNIQRCRLLGKEPLEVVHALRSWYENDGGRK